MAFGRCWIISLAIHLALLLGVAALIGEDERVDERDEPVLMSAGIPYTVWKKVDRIERRRDMFYYRGETPPEFLEASEAIDESWSRHPDGVTLFLYFPEGKAPCAQCIRMMQEAFGDRGKWKLLTPRVVGGRVTGTYVGWKSSLDPSDPRPRHPGGCRAYHLLGVDVFCTCCSIVDQRVNAMGEQPR